MRRKPISLYSVKGELRSFYRRVRRYETLGIMAARKPSTFVKQMQQTERWHNYDPPMRRLVHLYVRVVEILQCHGLRFNDESGFLSPIKYKKLPKEFFEVLWRKGIYTAADLNRLPVSFFRHVRNTTQRRVIDMMLWEAGYPSKLGTHEQLSFSFMREDP